MTQAERDLLAKARRREDITTDDKLSVIDTLSGLEWFRLGLIRNGIDTPENMRAVARPRWNCRSWERADEQAGNLR